MLPVNCKLGTLKKVLNYIRLNLSQLKERETNLRLTSRRKKNVVLIQTPIHHFIMCWVSFRVKLRSSCKYIHKHNEIIKKAALNRQLFKNVSIEYFRVNENKKKRSNQTHWKKPTLVLNSVLTRENVVLLDAFVC